jgi:hypothetical protein
VSGEGLSGWLRGRGLSGGVLGGRMQSVWRHGGVEGRVGCRVFGDAGVLRGLCEGAKFTGKVTRFRVMGLRGLGGMRLW